MKELTVRYIPIALVALFLCGCQSAAEKKAEWIAFCQQGDFNAKQCEVLYSLKESSDSAANNAAAASAFSGVAIGMSAGSRR